MNNYRKFNLAVLSVSFPGLLACGLFNIVIDPYDIFNSYELPGVNQLKTEKFKNLKLFKAIDITKIKPKTIFLGSSRAGIGLNPTHPAIVNQPAYNLALSGGNIYEAKRYFKHALANQPELETVVLGIDLFMFNELKVNELDLNEERLEISNILPQDLLSITLSLDAIYASANTIKSNLNPNAYHLFKENGMHYTSYSERHPPQIINRFKKSISEYFKTDGYYKEYHLSNEFLSDLQEIVSVCKKLNIDIKIFISPSHATQWEAARAAGLWSIFEEWKREVVEIIPVWDFSGYNSITAEPISEDMKNYWDNSHYRKEVGDLVLNRLFHYQEEMVPDDFGVLITPTNVEDHLSQIRTEQASWTKKDPDKVKFVEDLKPEK